MMTEDAREVLHANALVCDVIEPSKKHTATVIFLHGLGDSGDALRKLIGPCLKWRTSEGLDHIKFIFPSAPLMVVTGFGKSIIPSWFDCYSFDIPDRAEDEKGLYNAVKWVNEFISIEETQHHIPPERIIIGGLSQGGAVSLLTSITIKKPIAGLFALSTYIPLRNKTPEILTPLAKQIPIFWGHGKQDLQVDHEFSLECAKTLSSHLEIPFRSYENVALTRQELQETSSHGLRFYSYESLGHMVGIQELDDLFVWVRFLLPDVSE
ncbi:Phospholipase/carboxylesterase [Phlegmacium glaucopus]|nr:Phospholipase/carboxylesterase [Phlegmacium glaucopus]